MSFQRSRLRVGGSPLAGALALLVIALSFSISAQAGDLERAVIKETDNPIPQGAIFVSPNGSDRNPGTRSRPLRTVGAALGFAPEGGTVVIRRGIYREVLPDLSKPLTLQPFPKEEVWLKGSVVVAGWVKDGRVWRKDDWKPGFCQDCFHPDNIDPEFPNAGLPDQVFIDGNPLEQVSRKRDVKHGAFFVDHRSARLYIGSNPKGRLIEASVHGTALTIWQDGQGSIIRGLGFAHYAPVATPGVSATVKINADDVQFQDNTVAWSAAKGLEVFGQRASVRGNTFIHNGWVGMVAWKAHGLTVNGNRFARNNREMFVRTGPVSAAAGASITSTRSPRVTDNLFDANKSNGLWFDLSVTDAIVTRNIMRNNLRHGLFYEISSHGIIASNIVSGNGLSGIALADTTHVRVYNNTLFGNRIALILQDDDRINENPQEAASGLTWVSAGNSFFNNLVAGRPGAEDPYIWVRDFTGKRRADDMLSASNFNGFYRRDSGRPRELVEWWRKTQRKTFATLDEFRAATKRDLQSLLFDDAPEDPFFVNAPSGDFALKPGSVAHNAGRDLPRDIAKAIGMKTRSSPNLGALLLPGRRPVTPR